jgi:hypothetical protein
MLVEFTDATCDRCDGRNMCDNVTLVTNVTQCNTR